MVTPELEPSYSPQATPQAGPPPEQAPQETRQAPASKPAQPVNISALQTGLTRVTQENAALKKALGLSARATPDQVNEAIAQLRTPQQQATEDTDPEYDRKWLEIREREYQLAARAHSPEVVATVRQIEELAVGSASPLDLTDAVLELATILARQMNGQSPPQQAPANGQRPAPAPQDIAPEGDGPVSWHIIPEPEEKGTGDVEGAVKRMFAKLGR